MTKIVAGLAGAESAPARDRTGQPPGENHQPQNAILSKFETPRRSRGGSVGEWLSLVEHLVRDQGVGGSNPLSPTNFLKSNNHRHKRFALEPVSLSPDFILQAVFC